jgi:hypothetical protein
LLRLEFGSDAVFEVKQQGGAPWHPANLLGMGVDSQKEDALD